MSRQLKQARGINSEISIGIESVYNTAATTGKKITHNGSSVSASRELNNSETIISNRSAAEPFQGNGEVTGTLTVPNDFNQMGLILKAIFGNPASSAPADAKAASTVEDGETGSGTVVLTVAEGHGVTANDYFCIYGTTNYNGEHKATAATSTTITFAHAYTAETLSAAYVSKTGYSHVFKIKSEQPSFTMEQVHKDLAEMFLYTGCKIDSMRIGADSDGSENVVTLDVMGSKPATSVVPIVIDSFEESTDDTKITTKTAHGLTANDGVVIAGSTNYNGRYIVKSSADTTSFVIAKTYVAEAVPASSEPVCCKTQFVVPVGIPLKKINTFAAKVYKDGVEYKAAKNFNMTFEMGLDGDQRVIGDNGFRSEIPEGTVAVTTETSVLLKNGDWYRSGESNVTVGLKLVYSASYGIGTMTIDLPENKVNMASPGIEGPAGIVQAITAKAFSSDTTDAGSAATITLVSPYATF